jgi:putative ABC transport system permease protein
MLETNAPWLTVVGIAADVRHGLDQQPAGEFFRPYAQAGWPVMTVLARTSSAPRAFAPAVRRALLQIDPDQAASGVGTLEEALRESIGPRQLPTLLLSAFGLLALSLAAVGISGVVGYSVVQRTQEIGVRVALGAGTRDVLVLVLGRSMAWALAGIAAGLAGSFALTRLLEGMLFEVKPMDPFVLGGVSLVLAVVALLASSVPARRAAKVDPVVALRCN